MAYVLIILVMIFFLVLNTGLKKQIKKLTNRVYRIEKVLLEKKIIDSIESEEKK